MAYLEKVGHSLKENWSLVGHSFIFYYAILSIITVYVATLNYTILVSLVGHDFEPYFIGSFFTCMIFSLLIGAYLNSKLNFKAYLIWNLFGLAFGITLIFPISGLNGLLLYSVLGGFSLGLCIPGTIAHVINMTNYENRGSISGIMMVLTYFFIIIFILFINTAIQLGIFLILAKIVSILIALKIDFKKSQSIEGPFMKHGAMVKISFAIVWFIFILVNSIATASVSKLVSANDVALITTVTLVVGLISMFVGGLIMDEKGRKKLLIFCYAYLGLEYAMVSLSGGALMRYTYLDGIAWGILTVYFLMVLAGDIIFPKMRAVFVSIILSLSIIGQYLLQIFWVEIGVQIDQIFPLTVFFLFIAAVIVLILPETLPDRVMRKKELQGYIQKAKKIKEDNL
jgi:MFS family permease